MAATTQVRKTERRLAYDLAVGDVFAAVIAKEVGDPFQVSLYTVEEIYPWTWSDETITFKVSYLYGSETGSRIIGIRLMDFVTVV